MPPIDGIALANFLLELVIGHHRFAAVDRVVAGRVKLGMATYPLSPVRDTRTIANASQLPPHRGLPVGLVVLRPQTVPSPPRRQSGCLRIHQRAFRS